MKKNIIFLFLSFALLQAHGQKRLKWYGDKNYGGCENCQQNKVKYKKKVVTMSNGWNSKLRKKTYRKDEVYTPYGNAEYYYSNGKLEHKGYWKNGSKQGVWNTYFENGTDIRLVREFDDDKLKGVFKSFFRNGQIDEEIKLIDETFVYIKRYYANGELKEEGKAERESDYHYEERFLYTDKEDGYDYERKEKEKWVDSYVSFYSDGQIKEKGQHKLTFFDDGSIDDIKKVGLWQTYYSNGNIKTQSNYSKVYDDYYDEYDYKINGISKYNYENGKPFKLRYNDKNGDFLKREYYYKNGKLRIIITKDYDKKWQVFDDEGNTAELIYYDKDWKIVSNKSDAEFYRIYNPNKNGICRIVRDYYKESHKLKYEGYLKDVNNIDKSKTIKCKGFSKYYFDDEEDKYSSSNPIDRIKSEGFLNNQGKAEGQAKSYYRNGKIKVIANFKAGKRDGSWKWLFEDGKIDTEKNYVNGQEIKK